LKIPKPDVVSSGYRIAFAKQAAEQHSSTLQIERVSVVFPPFILFVHLLSPRLRRSEKACVAYAVRVWVSTKYGVQQLILRQPWLQSMLCIAPAEHAANQFSLYAWLLLTEFFCASCCCVGHNVCCW
jgi:hypothetical protein